MIDANPTLAFADAARRLDPAPLRLGLDVERLARVVLGLPPYRTSTRPKRVHQANDVNDKLLDGVGDSLP